MAAAFGLSSLSFSQMRDLFIWQIAAASTAQVLAKGKQDKVRYFKTQPAVKKKKLQFLSDDHVQAGGCLYIIGL